MKRLCALLMVALLLPVTGTGSANQDPQALVQETTVKITDALSREQAVIKDNPGRLFEIVDEVVLPHFDFKRMSSWVLGKYWRKADAAQREQFTREFRDLLVRTYANALNDNYDRKISMLPMRGKTEGGEVTVRTEVDQPGGFPIPIDYKMYTKEGAWKVYDVSVDGISLVANYRTSFAKEIRSDGLDSFIDKLAARNLESRGQ